MTMTARQTILSLIPQMHVRFIKYFSRRFAASRISHPQYMLLIILLEEGAHKMNSLAELLHISTPAVTNLVDKLERSGLARRLPHPTDRRAHVIDLTPRGRRLIIALRAESLELLADTIGRLPPSEQKVIEKFHRNLIAHLDEALGKHLGHLHARANAATGHARSHGGRRG
ncbi:MAG: MarR family transcriptional regulator [bacterium]|nr:MarR family transcriptional regulator [bacterium]